MPNPLLRRRKNRLAWALGLILLLFNGVASVVQVDAAPRALDVVLHAYLAVAHDDGVHVEVGVQAEEAQEAAGLEVHTRILARPRTQAARRGPSRRRCPACKSRASAWRSGV